MEREEIKKIIEGILFVSDEPVDIKTLQKVFDGGVEEFLVRGIIQELQIEYSSPLHGFELVEVAGGYQFRTKKEISEWIRRLEKFQPQRLSRSALEVLSIIAYKQPVTKAEIERIRGGTDSTGVLRSLLLRKLIKISGRKRDVPGRPFTYATTKKFLEVFGLRDLSDLPPIEDFMKLEEKGGAETKNPEEL